MIRIVVVDDRTAVRRALSACLALEPDLTVVGEAGDGEAALQTIQALHPDVVLMDVEMPRMDGISCTCKLRELAPQSAVVMLSLHDNAAARKQAHDAGAVAFIGKNDTGILALPNTIRVAARL